MARPEHPTSIRLTSADKRRLRKHADKYKHSLAGLIQMILMQWLEQQEKQQAVISSPEPVLPHEDSKPFIGAME
jgi:predicted transcriptional regulator